MTTTKITLVPPDINAILIFKKVDVDIKGDNDIDQEKNIRQQTGLNIMKKYDLAIFNTENTSPNNALIT
ncbi:unnamed protein product [Rhizophagus irregularis]|nr:unnamed protein product [Rhizophagus irregularis]CAB5350129.1 unnamed protein product [Rhizophagus irregularis]